MVMVARRVGVELHGLVCINIGVDVTLDGGGSEMDWMDERE